MISSSLLDPILNPIFLPLMKISPVLVILILSLLISIIITVVYKFATDQVKMKGLKDELKVLQGEMKELKDDPKKMMKKQKVLMSKNMEYTRHSFKATLWTMLPLIFIFGWMNAHLAFNPFYEDANFNVELTIDEIINSENMATLSEMEGIEVIDIKYQEGGDKFLFTLKGKEGTYEAPSLTFNYKDDSCSIPITITKLKDDFRYSKKDSICKDNFFLKKVVLKYDPVKPLGNISLLGWRPGWLGTYIIASLLFSTIIRKVFKVY